ncbi:MAG: hypothetical protein KGH75_01005 [Rhodospirillales bacterium]|nr:hypothetical protein [Rhodospirillales bacterium]
MSVTLRFSGGEGWEGAIVRWWTWSWAGHVGIDLGDGRVIDATPGPGVAVRAVAAGRGDRMFGVRCSERTAARVVAWARAQVGKPYDWGGVLAFLARRDWHDPRAWFCSELVAAAFEEAGEPLLRTAHLERVSPRDLLLSTKIEEVPA